MLYEFRKLNKVADQTGSAYYVSNIFKEQFMRDKKLTVSIHIGGKQVDSLTKDQCDRVSERLSEAMSLYYTAHPEEYTKIKR